MKNNRVIWIVIGIVVLCCCCLAVLGVVFGLPALRRAGGNSLNGLQLPPPALSSNGPAAGGLGDALLKTDVWNSIVTYEKGQQCSDVTSTSIDVSQTPDSNGIWSENWSVDACGSSVVFKVKFTPDPKGGTNYDITQ